MTQVTVTSPKLNRRKSPVTDFKDKSNIVDVLSKGAKVEIKGFIDNRLGKWYLDSSDNYIWEKGVSLPAAAVPVVNADWGFIDYGIASLWKFSKGKNIKVAVLDSGLDFNLPDFSSKSIEFHNVFTGTDNNKADCTDNDSGHGTDCAGMLCAGGATLIGVAPEIILQVIKITDGGGNRSPITILAGLRKALELNADIISVSCQLPRTLNDVAIKMQEDIHTEIKNAFKQNITIVAAAGNSGEVDHPVNQFPASFPECLSIGGVSKGKVRTKTSSKSDFLNLMGPGEDLIAVSQKDVHIDGTSFSTPFVAGVIALMKSAAKDRGKHLTNPMLFDILKRTADKNFAGYNLIEYGWGLINPSAAMQLIISI